jgi:hypothetical protein
LGPAVSRDPKNLTEYLLPRAEKRSKKSLTLSGRSGIFSTHTVTTNRLKMRTKALLLTAAVFAAGIATTLAQVYSLNVVGYYQVPMTNGFQMFAVQLDKDGTGTNNTLQSVFGTNGIPNNTRVYAFDGATYAFATYSTVISNWGGSVTAVNAALSLGRGVFVQVPGAATPFTITVVGQVPQGALTTPVNTNGYAIVSSQVPQAGLVQTALGLTPANSDRVYQFIAGSQAYGTARTYNSAIPAWGGGGEPNISVGEAFWLQGHAATTWTRNFTVQ